MADHYCQFVVHFPEDQSDRARSCDKPAGMKLHGNWLCAEHYDKASEGLGYACMSQKSF